MNQNRTYYEQFFKDYPDVVTVAQLCEMLGGISDKTAHRLIRQNVVQHYYIRNTYFIPKVWAIDYVMSDHYKEYKKCLKAQIRYK